MGIGTTDSNDPSTGLYPACLLAEKDPVCFFCHKEIAGLFVVWAGTDYIYLHCECACRLGQELIRDGLDTSELISRTNAGLPSRLRGTVVPHQVTDSRVRKDEHSRQYRGITLTGTGGGTELSGRLDRLSEAISYAAGQASIKRHVDEDVFLSSILAAHDHKGCLSNLWNTRAAALAFGPLMVNAWEYVSECADNVEHFVNEDDGPCHFYSGRDVKLTRPNDSSMGYCPF